MATTGKEPIMDPFDPTDAYEPGDPKLLSYELEDYHL